MILDIGDGSSAAPDMVQVTVRPGDTVVVAVLATSAASANVFQNGVDQAATTVTAGNNVSVSIPGTIWVSGQAGITSVQITGGFYGVV